MLKKDTQNFTKEEEMKGKFKINFIVFFVVATFFLGLPMISNTQSLNPEEELGKLIMFDTKLSLRNNQSCASCHASISGWTGPIPGINLRGSVYFGSDRTKFGNRKPPSAAYATTSPRFDYDLIEGLFFGGNFWDGRATGWDLGNPAADQARGPFLNPVEQALFDKAAVVNRVCSSKYVDLFKAVWGPNACDNVDLAYDNIALSIADYENSVDVNQFSSKFDAVMSGQATFTEQEASGFSLFADESKGKCALCHVIEGLPEDTFFTDYTFDNLGVPKNPLNPFYESDPDFVDNGLGGFLRRLAENDTWKSAPFVTDNVKNMTADTLNNLADENDGKHKVPTLRNVDKRPATQFIKAYGHNGYFKSLESIVHFYNTRDVKDTCPGDYTDQQAMAANCWPAPEVTQNVNADELGNLGLTPEEEADIVAFLKTLSDGYTH
jgi:cytochrome c peroxidase